MHLYDSQFCNYSALQPSVRPSPPQSVYPSSVCVSHLRCLSSSELVFKTRLGTHIYMILSRPLEATESHVHMLPFSATLIVKCIQHYECFFAVNLSNGRFIRCGALN
jgi:hypothetical protein